MKAIAVQELTVRPDEVWQQLREEQDLLLIADGQPVALLVEVDVDEVEVTLAALRRARAQVALSRLRRAAAEQGTNHLSADEIEAEIAATRRERRA